LTVDLLDRIEAGLDAIDAAVGESGASRSAAKRAAAARPSRAKRMKTKAQSAQDTEAAMRRASEAQN
jgi:hypothetical protein